MWFDCIVRLGLGVCCFLMLASGFLWNNVVGLWCCVYSLCEFCAVILFVLCCLLQVCFGLWYLR